MNIKIDRKLVLVILGILIIAALAFYVISTQNKTQNSYQYIDLSKTETLNLTDSDDVLKIGVSAMISPKGTLSVYQEMVDYIGEKIGKKVKLVQRETYAQMNELVENKEVLAAFVCSGPYVEGHEKFGMELIAVPQMYNETIYYSYIIVHKDSKITSFEELRGKMFAFTDPLSNTGKNAPTYVLSKMNETPDTFFSNYIFTGSHDNSIEAVAKNLVDGASVDHLIWEYINKRNPEFTSKTKIIEKLGPYAIPPMVTHPDTDPELKEKLRSILLNMDRDETGKRILSKIEIDKFVVIDPASYDSVREMVAWENKLKN